MLTAFTPGPSDPALFDTVIDLSATTEEISDTVRPRTEIVQINVADGGRIGFDGFDGPRSFSIQDTELNITGGNIGDGITIFDAEINIDGGVIGDAFTALGGQTVTNFNDGEIGNNFNARTGLLNINGGVIGDDFITTSATVNIHDGVIGSDFTASTASNVFINGGEIGTGDGDFTISVATVNISGGVIHDNIVTRSSDVNLFVLEYQLDGVPQDSSVIGEAVTITDRGVTLSGLLSDGSSFSYFLDDRPDFRIDEQEVVSDRFLSTTLTITIVEDTVLPNEAASITGDFSAVGSADSFNVELLGDVDVSDADRSGSEERFRPQLVKRGAFGDFNITAIGRWGYVINQAAVESLTLGQSVSESFEIATTDGTTETVTVTINGVARPVTNQDSTITGNLTPSGLANQSTISGVVSVTDPDVGFVEVLDSGSGEVIFGSTALIRPNAVVGHAFEITSRTRIDEIGAFFAAFSNRPEDGIDVAIEGIINRLSSADDVPDNLDLTGSDFVFSTEFLVDTGVAGVVLAPVTGLTLEPGFYSLSFASSDERLFTEIFGVVTHEINETPGLNNFRTGFDSFVPVNPFAVTGRGTRFIINGELDPPNVSQVVPQSGIQGDFGVFNVQADGNYEYVIDTDAVETLLLGQSVSENFQIVSIDGTAIETITVTVNGVNQAVIANDTALAVAEDAVDGATVGTVLASDPDGEAPSIGIISGNEAGVFAVDAAGNVTVADASQLDFDATPEFVLVFEASDGLTTATATLTISVIAVEDIVVFGTTQDDFLEGNDLNNVLIGDRGSDVLVGSRGNDIFITDAINGNSNGNDRDIIRLGNVDGNDSGNDVVTDFDVNGTNGGENNFDALEFTFDGVDFSISSRNDIRRFVRFIETDGDVRTDAILDGNDLILVFGRDSEDPSIITSSVRLEDVVGQNGLTQRRLRRDSVDLLGTAELDVFFASGVVEIGSTAGETLVGGEANDVIVGGAGSDTLFGGAGNDTLTGDQTDGGIFGSDQDTFAISEIAPGNVGNDVITDFDVNNFDGGENNFDTLTLTLGNQDFSLSTGQDFLEFAELLDNDGNDDTGTLIDGDDIIFVFGRNSLGFITDSVRLKDVIGDDGLTNASLAAFNRVGESERLDVFIV